MFSIVCKLPRDNAALLSGSSERPVGARWRPELVSKGHPGTIDCRGRWYNYPARESGSMYHARSSRLDIAQQRREILADAPTDKVLQDADREGLFLSYILLLLTPPTKFRTRHYGRLSQ